GRGSRKGLLIPLEDALPAGGFQVSADLRGLIGGPEWAYQGAVVNALVAEVSTLDHRRMRSQYGRELALKSAIGCLGIGLVALRGDLNQITRAVDAGSGRGLDRVDVSEPRSCIGGGGRRPLRNQRHRGGGVRVGR